MSCSLRLASFSWSLFIHLFLLMNFGESHEHHHQHMQSVNGNGEVTINDADMIFFTPNDLKMGKRMPIYFPRKVSSTSPLLPKEQADKIPFSHKQLPTILQFFSLSPGSLPATAVENTLRYCENEPITGEFKICATSFESMLDSVNAALGVGSRFRGLTTVYQSNSGDRFQNYTFLETPKVTTAAKYLSCHTSPYPYAVFYCHQFEGGSMAVEIKLEGDDGERVDAVANCHVGTSHFSPDHISFKILKVQPGTVPICHFFPAGDILWIPVSDTATA